MRDRRYTSRSREQVVAWQRQVRDELWSLLHLEDLVLGTTPIPLDARVLAHLDRATYAVDDLEISSTPDRRIRAVFTRPRPVPQGAPAVVCVHGHGGDRFAPFDAASIYHGFAAELAARGFVTVSTDVGQHEVYEPGRTLMGERLWDLVRCVDYLEGLAQVDASRIGCCGLSLGGEMAMWLGAMDRRLAATVSAGFLTAMDQMEQNHCMCWKFPGLRKLVDYADIYSLIAPRPLMCQNGLLEPADQFCVPLARKAMEEIRIIYDDLGELGHVLLDVHPGGHEIHLPAVLAFFDRFLHPQMGNPRGV